MSPRNFQRAAAVMLLLSECLSSSAVYGKSPRPPRTATPTAQERSAPLIAQGVMALASRNFASAYAALAEAYLIDHSAETLYQLGIVAYAEGQTIASQDLMRRYLAVPAANAGSAQQRAEAERIVSQPQGQRSELILTGEAESRVEVDGRIVGVLPLPMPLLVSSGSHVITIKNSTTAWSQTLDVAAHRAYLLTPESDGKLKSLRLPTALLEVDGDLPQGSPGPQSLAAQSVRNSGLFLVTPPVNGKEECKGEARCTLRLADQSFADYLLVLEGVQAAATSGGNVTVSLIDTQIGEPAAQAKFPCSPCAEGALAESLSRVLPGLLSDATQRGRGILRIVSQPVGAMVQIGSRKLGATPLAMPRFAGSTDWQLRRPGYQVAQGRSEVKPGQTTEVTIPLAAEVLAPLIVRLPPERQPRPKWRIASGLAGLGIGAGLMALGASALAVSGQCVEPAAPPQQSCTRLYHTSAAGAGLLATGVAFGVTGAVLLAIPGPRNRDLRPVPSEAVGPWALAD